MHMHVRLVSRSGRSCGVLHAMMRCGALGRAREPMITKAWAANSVASSIAWSRSRKKSRRRRRRSWR